MGAGGRGAECWEAVWDRWEGCGVLGGGVVSEQARPFWQHWSLVARARNPLAPVVHRTPRATHCTWQQAGGAPGRCVSVRSSSSEISLFVLVYVFSAH